MRFTTSLFLDDPTRIEVFERYINFGRVTIFPEGEAGIASLVELRDAIDLYIEQSNVRALNELDKMDDVDRDRELDPAPF